MYPETVTVRFWAKVARCDHQDPCTDCCWLWQGHRCKGYGTLGIPKAYRTGRSKSERANRVAWQIAFGPIPPGLHVLHNCPGKDNPACVNPDHLWVGTIDDNQKDSMRKGTRPRGDQHGLRLHPDACRRGETNPQAKLTTAQVYGIRAEGARGEKQAIIAARYMISRSLVGMILQRKVWRHLEELDSE